MATIEADGTMIETKGQKKEGLGMNYKGQWGYQALAITLAETREQLFLKNRPGSRPSHEGAAHYLDKSVELCHRAGFRQIRLRGDTDFSQTTHLDRWDNDGVEFVFGYDAAPNLVQIAEKLGDSAWEPLTRKPKYETKTGTTRARRENHKEAFVVAREYKNQILEDEEVAEFSYSPTACQRSYRMIVLRKTIKVMKGQRLLFREPKYFFFITNLPRRSMSTKKIVAQSNARCDQENIFAQGKDMGALAVPLHDVTSNWAYMVMAMLAWNLKCWLSLSAEAGRQRGGSREAFGTENAIAANGLLDVPSAADFGAVADPAKRPGVGVSLTPMDANDGDNFPSALGREPAAAPLTQRERAKRHVRPSRNVAITLNQEIRAMPNQNPTRTLYQPDAHAPQN